MRSSQYHYLNWFAYILYAILLTCLLLIIRFPDEKLKTFLVDTVEENLQHTQCSLGGVFYQFPLAIKVHDLQLKSVAESKLIFKVDDILIRAELDNPVKRFTLSFIAYGREHGCRVRVDWQKNKIFVNRFNINQLNLGELHYIHDKLGRKLSGIMNISGTYTDSEKKGDGSVAKGNIVITNGELELLRPILFQNSINIKNAETDFILKRKFLEFSNGHFNGSRLKGDFTGSVHLISPWFGTKMNMKGKLFPKAAILKNNPRATKIINRLKKQHKSSALPFIIKGELGKPVFRFGS